MEGEGKVRGREGRVGAWVTEERGGGEEGEVKGREGDWCPPPHMTSLHDAPGPCYSCMNCVYDP